MKKLSARLSVSGNLQLMNFFRRKKIKAANNAIGGRSAAVDGVSETNGENGAGANGTVGSVAWNNIFSTTGSKLDYQGEDREGRRRWLTCAGDSADPFF